MGSRRRAAALLLVLCCALGLAAPSGRAAPAVPRRVALVIGISSYDASTGVPQLPQCETTARALGHALDSEAETRLMVRRVTRQGLLDGIRDAGRGCAKDDLFIVFVVAAFDDEGVVASDGHATRQQLRQAVNASPASHRVLAVDGAGGARLVEETTGDTVVLASTRLQQTAWSGFFPYDDCVRFESAAAHGWCRALEKDGADWKGDLGDKGSVCVEDLRMCGDEDAEQAVPDREGRRVLDAELGMKVLEAVRPATARRLRKGGEPRVEDLRSSLGDVRFVQLAGVLAALSSDTFVDANAAVRRRIGEAVEGREPMAALQAVHDVLVRERLLETPSDLETKVWKRLVLGPDGTVDIVLPATQAASLRGRSDMAVLGARHHVHYRVPYGRFEGDVSGSVSARLRLEVLGSYVSGHWEGEVDGKWLRGDWQGTFDPRTGELKGRSMNRSQSEGITEKAPVDTVWPAMFEGKVTEEGTVLSGTWRSLNPTVRLDGKWKVVK